MNRDVFANAGKVRTTVIMFAASLFVASGAFAQITDVATLEAAIAAGNPGDTFNLAAGTYAITQPIVLKDNQTFSGAGAGSTIIDGGDAMRIFEALGTDDGLGGFLADTGQTGWTIEGMTLTKGLAHATSAGNDDGGALVLRNGAWGAVQDCVLSECEATSGGAIDVNDMATDQTFSLIRCELINNFAPVGQGGAMDYRVSGSNDSGNNGTTLFIDSCVFDGNTAGDPSNNEDGGAFHSRAPNAAMVDSQFTIINTVFTNNSNTDDSTFETRGNTIVANCTFVGNITADRGPITANPENDLLTRSVFTYTNNIFVGNECSDGDGVIMARQAAANITATNNLFLGNVNAGGMAVANFDGTMITETGSLSEVDPLFASATDFRLTAGSPAIDAGVDTSADGVTLDLDGKDRPIGAAHDLGAYEFGVAGPPPEVTNVNDWALYE